MIVTSHLYDGNISIPGCDKNMPGCLIAAARHNRPTIIVYGGSILAGKRTVACPGLGQEVGDDINIGKRLRRRASTGLVSSERDVQQVPSTSPGAHSSLARPPRRSMTT